MPTTPVNRSNAWTYWSNGQIAATNIDDKTIESTSDKKVLGSLALKRGLNAIRLWLGSWSDVYTIADADITAIAQSGWGSPQLLSTANGDPTRTIASVAAQVTKILDTCQQLGMGVLMVTNFGGGGLWENSTNGTNLRSNLKDFWLKTYAYWSAHPALIGFDLLNEPSPPSDGTSFATIKSQSYSWPQLAQSIVTAIRGYETSNSITTPLPLIVEGIYGGTTRSLGVFDDPSYTQATGPYIQDAMKRIVYSFHYYEPGCITHQGVLEWDYESFGTPYPLPGVVQISYWYDGVATYELRPYATPADIQATMQKVIDFRNKFKVPIFVGEFSAAQPNIDQVYPQLSPPRSQQLPNQRVSEVQNNVAWQAPLLNKLTTIATQADFDTKLSSDEKAAISGLYTLTYRRWITKLVVGTDGYVTATLDNINTPAPDQLLGTGFRVTASPKTLAQLSSSHGGVKIQNPSPDGSQWARPGTLLNDDFYSQPLAKIVAQAGAVGAAFNMAGSISVTLTRHAYTIRFPAPQGAVPNTVLDGFTTPQGIKLPVALLWLDSPRTGAAIDQSRFDYVRDVLQIMQSNGFSWAWFGDDTNSPSSVVNWRPSKQISELLADAAANTQLTPRA